MRLAIVTHNIVRGDGQGRVAYEIARQALREGHHVSLIANRVEGDLAEAGAIWVPVRPRLHRVNLSKVWEFAVLADRVLARGHGLYDLVQAFGFTLSRPHDVNTSQFVHDAWGRSPVHTFRLRHNAYGFYQWLYTRMNTRWEARAYRKARVIVAASGQVRRELVATGLAADRIRVIMNAADPQEFHPGPGDRDALGLPPRVPLALFAGDIRTPRKNLDTVLRALASVPGTHLAVVGATEGSPYPKLANDLGLTNRVHFLGFRRDMPQIMRAADLFVFPSRYEPFGIVVLEAMGTGLPVITAATVGASEIVGPQCGVILDDPDDVSGLARVMQALTGDPERRACMGRAARAVAERHTWAAMAEDYLRLYEEVAS